MDSVNLLVDSVQFVGRPQDHVFSAMQRLTCLGGCAVLWRSESATSSASHSSCSVLEETDDGAVVVDRGLAISLFAVPRGSVALIYITLVV